MEVVVFVLLAAMLAHAAGDPSDEERAVLRGRIASYDAHARYPLPTLSDADLDRLLEGKVVKLREVHDDGGQRVTGLLVAEASPTELYASASDPHLVAVDELHEVLVNPGVGYPRRWVQLLDLPRPFADRYWAVDIWDNLEMAKATDGLCWEHWWRLTDDGEAVARDTVEAGKLAGIDLARLDSAIYVGTNTGAFVYVALPEGRTLFGFHAMSTVGGLIPDSLVASYTQATVGRMLRTVVDRVDEACAHLDAEHAPLVGGDGARIPSGCGR